MNRCLLNPGQFKFNGFNIALMPVDRTSVRRKAFSRLFVFSAGSFLSGKCLFGL
jgi:hypothetical protein